jgi:Fe-S-cluster containining protein
MRKKIEVEWIMENKPECKKCGECCKVISFGAIYGGADWNEYYYHRGVKLKDGTGALVPSICPHLKRQDAGMGETEYICDIYDHRPQLCRQEEILKKGLRFYRPPGCNQ